MATVNFLYRSKKESSYLSLRLLFRYNEKDIVLSEKTKVLVSSEYWFKKHSLKRPKDILIINKQIDINNELNKIQNFVLKAFSNEKNTENVSKIWLGKVISKYYNPEKADIIPNALIEFIDFYIDTKDKDVSINSVRKYKYIQTRLLKLQYSRGHIIHIKDINESFRNEFAKHYRMLNYSQNTIQKEFSFIKTFCKHARYLGLETHPQLDKLNFEKEKVSNIYLTPDDIKSIKKVTFEKDYLDNARDWLLISIYTGQRISDFSRFDITMIRKTNKISLLEFTQKKTGKVMSIPLHPEVLKILEKREGHFPRKISDQKYNGYIKEVCKFAEIKQKVTGGKLEEVSKGVFRKLNGLYEKWELVTSHIGRRSFATNNYGKIPTPLLMHATGHSTEKMFLNYINKSNQDSALELAKYFNYE
jgi:integrase